MKNGNVLDSIQVNDQRFGGPGGTVVNRIDLALNERVTSISYNSQKNDAEQHCNLSINTNIRSYGPYSTQPPVCDTGSANLVTRSISDSETGFLDFLKTETGNHWGGQIKFSVDEWTVKSGEDCWASCNSKGGSCTSCGDDGYCCSGTKSDLNGNCPTDAVNAVTSSGSTDMHQCVQKIIGKRIILRIPLAKFRFRFPFPVYKGLKFETLWLQL